MKALGGLLAVILIAVIGLYALSNYIFMEKQGSTSQTSTSTVEVIPIEHASLILKWGDLVVYADPVGDPSLFASQPRPKIILVTHEHPDHFSTSTLESFTGEGTAIVAPQSVADKMPDTLKSKVTVMKNGDTITMGPLTIEAVPAYNLRKEAQMYHPKGRDNGYVLYDGTTRVYIAGDTEGTPEMRALQNIDIAFVPMNLPYTMSVEDAADAVLAFKPKTVYPYHYRGQNGLSDVQKFKQLVHASSTGIAVTLANWYPN